MYKSTSVFLVATALAVFFQAGYASVPRVVVSIAPIHSLVAGVMQGVGEPELLYPAGQSPHTGALTPSKVRAIHSADMVIWSGPEMEVAMVQVLSSVDPAAVRSLEDVAELVWLPARSGGKLDDEHGHDGHDHDGHESNRDPHMWLSSKNARIMVEAFAEWMSEMDPENESVYRQNATRLTRQIDSLDEQIRIELEQVSEIPYLVFHDAYQYFEKEFGLAAAGSISISPDRMPGARRISEFHHMSEKGEVQCVFSEPQFEPALVDTIIGGSVVRSGVLDPIGANLQAGPKLWFELMEALSQSLRVCLLPGA